MLIYSRMPTCFWAEAVSTAAYLINMSSSVPLDFKIPQEAWSGNEVDLEHLKVFGCATFVLKSKEKRGKLDPKSLKTFFVGYGKNMFGYRCWNLETREIVRAKNIVFVESELYKHRERTSTVPKDAIVMDVSPLKESDDQHRVMVNEEVADEESIDRIEEEIAENSFGEDNDEVDQDEGSEEEPAQLFEERPHFVRKSTKPSKQPDRLGFPVTANFLLLIDEGEPESYREALRHKDSKQWEPAIHGELKFLADNNT